MKPAMKIVLIGCGALFLTAVIAVTAVVMLWRANEGRIKARADAVRAEGRQFARTSTPQGCVAEAFRQYREDMSLTREVRARMWLIGCLESQPRNAELCARVPSTDEIARTVAWRFAECSRQGFDGDKGCLRIVTEIQKYCEKKP